MSLLDAMNAAREDNTCDHCKKFLFHTRRFPQWCITRESFTCDVNEDLWPNQQERQDVQEDGNLVVYCEGGIASNVAQLLQFSFIVVFLWGDV